MLIRRSPVCGVGKVCTRVQFREGLLQIKYDLLSHIVQAQNHYLSLAQSTQQYLGSVTKFLNDEDGEAFGGVFGCCVDDDDEDRGEEHRWYAGLGTVQRVHHVLPVLR